MKKLDAPAQDAILTYDTCVAAVSDLALRNLYSSNRPSIQQANADFDAASVIAEWAALPRLPNGSPNAFAAGALTKRNLMDLYARHMVGSTGPSRQIYDSLLTAAGGFCPLCGGLGHARTLDHYLPKANFPAFSVSPRNLLPCCRDCNTGKNASFGAQLHQQTIHPYLDQAHFFEQRWLAARVYAENPILVRYECAPPIHWSDNDSDRVRSHFAEFKLAYRFSVQAGGEIAKITQLRSNSLHNLNRDDFRAYLIDNADSPGFVLNGWSRTMYAALSATEWFLTADFGNPQWHLAIAQ